MKKMILVLLIGLGFANAVLATGTPSVQQPQPQTQTPQQPPVVVQQQPIVTQPIVQQTTIPQTTQLQQLPVKEVETSNTDPIDDDDQDTESNSNTNTHLELPEENDESGNNNSDEGVGTKIKDLFKKFAENSKEFAKYAFTTEGEEDEDKPKYVKYISYGVSSAAVLAVLLAIANKKFRNAVNPVCAHGQKGYKKALIISAKVAAYAFIVAQLAAMFGRNNPRGLFDVEFYKESYEDVTNYFSSLFNIDCEVVEDDGPAIEVVN